MRKFCWLFFLFFLLTANIKCLTLDLTNELVSFEKIDNFNLQGFTVVDDYLFMVLVEKEDVSSIIKVYDIENKNFIKSYSYSTLGHANDVTYNSKNQKIYVLRGGGSNLVDVFDKNNFSYLETIRSDLPIRSITYNKDNNLFYVRTVASGFIFNEDLKLNNKFPFVIGMNFNRDIGRQGWEYYNGFIYYTNWSWIRLGGDGINIIYLYDLKGNMRDTLYTSKNIGEIEGISFYKNKMILGFNGYDNKIKFFINDIPNVPNLEDEKTKSEDVEDKNYLYINIGIGFFILLFLYLFVKKMCK